MPKDKKWLRFELLAKEIQEQLSPDALVEHNIKVMGKSGSLRQIDISVKQKVGQFDIFIAIDCKDYNKKLDVKHIEEFAGLIQDVNAYKGAMVTFLGYTETARRRADALGIDLFRLVDTESKDWQIELTIPVYFIEKTIETWSLEIGSGYAAPLTIPNVNPRFLTFFNEEHRIIGSAERYLAKKWNRFELNTNIGNHDTKLTKVYISDGKGFYPCDLTFSYNVIERYYVVDWGISDLKGFVDEKSGGILTRKFTVEGELDLKEIEKKWRQISEIDPAKHDLLMVFEIVNMFVI